MIIVLNDKQFGRNLRYLRRKHHYSRVELANLTVCFPKDIKAWEEGKCFDVDSIVMRSICRLFQVDIETMVAHDLKKERPWFRKPRA